MFERFARESRAVVADAQSEASALGAPAIESEHLLLSLTRRAESEAGKVLVGAGLDYQGTRDALAAEVERSLAAVGVSADLLKLRESSIAPGRNPRWGASAKLAFKRAHETLHAHGGRHLTPTHLLLGVLAAEAGTVPRALAGAGIDQGELVRRAEEALD